MQPKKRRRGRPREWWITSTLKLFENILGANLIDWEDEDQDINREAVALMATNREGPFAALSYSDFFQQFGANMT